MPTIPERKRFVEQSLKYFENQDYPNKELIIVESVDDTPREDRFALANVISEEKEIYHLSLHGPSTIGEKRNIACSLAKGDLICHWDDDDYYAPHRLSLQAKPLIDGIADVSGIRMDALLYLPGMVLWRCSQEEHKRLFPLDVRCSTIMYWSHYYHDLKLRYADSNYGEDFAFLSDLMMEGARLHRMDNNKVYVCVRHDSNVTPSLIQEVEEQDGWGRGKVEEYLSEEAIQFYRRLGRG